MSQRHTLESLYAELGPSVLGLAFRLTGDRATAEDVMQETFLAVHRSLKTFRGESRVETWVYRIAVNAANRARAQRTKWNRHRDTPLTPQDNIDTDARDRLLAAMDRLSDDHRLVLSLMTGRSIPAAVVAELIGVPEGTVYSRAFAARRALRRELEHAEPTLPDTKDRAERVTPERPGS